MSLHRPKALVMKHALPAAAAIFAIHSAYAAPIVIDGFQTAQQVADNPAGPVPDSSAVVAGEVLGGERDLTVGGATSTLGVVSSVVANSGEFKISNGPDTISTTTLIYDGVDGDANSADVNGLGGVDLVDGTNTGFEFTVEFSDFAFDYELFVFDGVATESATGTLPAPIFGTGDEQTVFISFSSFSGALDFTDVGFIALELTTTTKAGDLVVSDFSVVPEPSSMALLLLAGISMVSRPRKA